ncbi:MAG: hypothetical protein GY757_33820, partial [bacterium]|nr:hypothetical protein [bacterium]
YQVQCHLTDMRGQKVLEYTETLTVNAGQEEAVNITLPAELQSGNYVMYQKAKETHSGKETTAYSQHHVTGLSATLNSYTLKEKYFDNETVTAKSDIASGSAAITNAHLEAQIVKLQKSGGSIQTLLDGNTFNNSLAKDSQNRILAGTTSGVSVYDGTTWQHYNTLPSGAPCGAAADIATGPGDKIYAFVQKGILVIDNNSLSLIPHPEFFDYNNENKYLLAVDSLARPWCLYGYTEEAGELKVYRNGEWEGVMEWTECKTMVPGKNGGMWLGDWEQLYHFDNQLNSEVYDTFEWGLQGESIQSLYLDKNGTIWLTAGYDYASGWKLLSFNGTTPIDYSNLENSPAAGVGAVCGSDGTIFVSGIDENQKSLLYRLETDKFVKIETGDFRVDRFDFLTVPDLVHADNFFYTNAFIAANNGSQRGLIKIGGLSGAESTVWNQSYPLSLTNGTTSTVNLEPGLSLEPGPYLLRTHLQSSINQTLAESFYFFTIRGTAVSLSLKGEPQYGKYVKTGAPLNLTLETFNNTPDTKTGLVLSIQKTSPAGEVSTPDTYTVTFAPGQGDTRPLLFNETETGSWNISATLKEGSTLLSETEMTLEVTEPSVTTTAIAPEFAGDDAFPLKLKLTNSGNIDASVTCSIPESDTNETVLLKPGEARVIETTGTVTADPGSKTFNIA